MIRRDLRLPGGEPLEAEEISKGLFVIKGAYADEADSFSGISLYIKSAHPAPAEPDASRNHRPAGR
jgi:hypothetical protein